MQNLFEQNTIETNVPTRVVCIPYTGLRAFHIDGNWAMLAITFQGLKGALQHFSDKTTVNRHQLSVLSGHPGTGVRDAFEYVTRAVTRGVYGVDTSLPVARWNPNADFSYSFDISDGVQTLRCVLREQVLPSEFFTFFGQKVSGQASDEAQRQFDDLKLALELKALAMTPEDLFEYIWL